MSEPVNLPGRGIRPGASLRAHSTLALVVALVVLLAGIPVVFLKSAPKYLTESVIQVAPRYMKNLREDQEVEFQSNTQYRQFVQQTLRSVTRYDILRDAIASLGAKADAWKLPDESERRSVERLAERLLVAAVPDTYLLRINLEAGKREKEVMADLVNAVTQTFLTRMKNEDIYGSDERAKNLIDRERELLALIAAKAGQRSIIARDLSLTTFNEGTPNPYDRLVADLRAKLSDARQRRYDGDAQLAAYKKYTDTNINVRSVSDAVLNDPGLNALKAALYKRRADLLVQISGMHASHPQRQLAEREFREIDAEILAQTDKLRQGVHENLSGRLAATADQVRKVEQDLAAELAELEARATEFARLFQQAMAITAELTQSRLELEKVRDRVNYLNIERTSLGFLRLVSPALPPEMSISPSRKKLLMMVVLAALVAGLIAPVVVDLLDRRLYTANDVEKLMGIPPAGWQIDRTDAASEIYAQEQLRRLASSLIRSRDNDQRRVFGFSGIKPGVGATSLVLDLATTLKALGYKVVAVEANGFSPDRRYATGHPGLADYLRGDADASALIGVGQGDEPDRVSVGQGDRLALQRLDRLKLLLKQWADELDFVLVDMPPLLVAADAELLCRTIGNTLLVVEAGRSVKGEVLRAKRLLHKIDPDAVGVVVNRIALFSGNGYLREEMLESISGRRASLFFTLSGTRLMLESWRLRWARWQPWRRR